MPRELRWWGVALAGFGTIYFVQALLSADERILEAAIFGFALLVGQMLPLPPGWRERIRTVPWYLRMIVVAAVLLMLAGVAVILGTISGLEARLSMSLLLILCGGTLFWVAR